MNFHKIHKITTLKQNLLLALVSIVFFFLFAEGFLTLVGFRPVYAPFKQIYYVGRRKEIPQEKRRPLRDPLLFWRLNPRKGEINSAGFRSKKEYSINKEKNTKRIICLGDSITYGVWVKKEEAYPYILEEMLNASSDFEEFEVVNAGVMGYTSLQGLRQLKRDLIKYKPDLVTALFGFDDNHSVIDYSDKEQKTSNKYIFSLQKILRNSKLYCLLEISLRRGRHWFVSDKNNLSQEIPGKIKRRVEPDDYRRNLQEIARLAEEKNFEVLFLTPVIFRLKEKEINYLNNYKEELPQEYDVDLLGELKRYQDQADLFLDSCHFTPAGHWVVAKTLYDTLVKKKIVSLKQNKVNIPMPAYSNTSLPEEIKESNLKNYIKMGENDVGALAFGWGDLEKIEDKSIRLIDGFHANAFLKNNPLEGADKRLSIEMFSYISNKVEIFINDSYLATVECLPNLWQEVELKFQDNSNFLKISFFPSRISSLLWKLVMTTGIRAWSSRR